MTADDETTAKKRTRNPLRWSAERDITCPNCQVGSDGACRECNGQGSVGCEVIFGPTFSTQTKADEWLEKNGENQKHHLVRTTGHRVVPRTSTTLERVE
jgi:hypothetical protein